MGLAVHVCGRDCFQHSMRRAPGHLCQRAYRHFVVWRVKAFRYVEQ